MKIILILLLFIALPFGLISQDKVDWHAYMQLRASSNMNDSYNVSVRRLKFWINSGSDFSDHWSFKVQAIFISFRQEKLFLQDAYGQYASLDGNHSLRFGQLTPKYSLQWTQRDYLMPSLERALSVNALVPDGSLGVRDLGMQYTFKALDKNLEMNIGAFKGRGITEFTTLEKGFLLSQNSFYKFHIKNAKLKLGYSLMYRKAYNLPIKHVLADSVLFTGNDSRFGVYGMLQTKHFDFQTEYLRGLIGGSITDGYYALATIKINTKNQVFLSYDKYTDIISTTVNNPWYFGGYNYFIKDYKLMISLQIGFQDAGVDWRNLTILQFQMFIH
jgi:hypothetical protein